MRKLKTMLAWLNWSTYGNPTKLYEFPKSLCSLFWLSIFALVTIPVSWPAHVRNVFMSASQFKEGWQKDTKLTGYIGAGSHFLFITIGFMGHLITEKVFKWDFFVLSDGCIVNYIKLLLVSIPIIIALLMVIVMIWGIIWCIKQAATKKATRVDDYGLLEETETDRGIVVLYKSIKNKYCPTIDWTYLTIKNK
tara:strand:+ start:1038 stop:1616 length:579 start_codon:yes stop_codon:yes gene_type:complete